MRSARLGIALALVTLGGCDGSSGPSSALCSTAVEVSVTVAASPEITWTPACLVQQVEVVESVVPSVGGSQPRWALEKATGIAAPLRYARVPAGARVLLAAEPLVSGHHYVVQLSMAEIVGNSSIVGEGGFTR
jgi:hypothetical protein